MLCCRITKTWKSSRVVEIKGGASAPLFLMAIKPYNIHWEVNMSVPIIASLLMQLLVSYGGLDQFIEKAGVTGGSRMNDSYCIEASNSKEIRNVLKQGAIEFDLTYEEAGNRTCLRGEIWKRVPIQLSVKDERMLRNEWSQDGLWIVY